MKTLFWKAYTHLNRHEAIDLFKQIISQYGSIMDFKPFSDLDLSLEIWINEDRLPALLKSLQEHFTIDAPDFIVESNQERLLYLNITFTQSTGNLIVEVPDVPG
jgi:hypothetical protein